MLSRSEFRELVDREISRQYDLQLGQAPSGADSYTRLLVDLKEFILKGGKRNRPYLLYLGYVGWGGADVDSLVPIAACLEIMHNFLLIHDDIIDRDLIRYGGPNIEGQYRERFAGKERGEKFAQDVALLAGDIAHLVAIDALVTSAFTADQKVMALRLVTEKILETSAGQIIDVLPYDEGVETVEGTDITGMYALKTGGYSFVLPLLLGATLAGVERSEEVLAFATPLGIAFQIGDDLIGTFGSTSSSGKPVDGDIREGKQTVLYSMAKERMVGEDADLLSMLYGKRTASAEEIALLATRMEACGVRSEGEALRDRYLDQAKVKLSALGLTEEAEKTLEVLAETIRSRVS
ncbi:MAG: polyprenyl synthetase family protein [bacterium]